MKRSFGGFCGSMFVVGSGLSTLETSANPFIATCGPPKWSELRLNLAQAFQAIGSVVAPYVIRSLYYSTPRTNISQRSCFVCHLQERARRRQQQPQVRPMGLPWHRLLCVPPRYRLLLCTYPRSDGMYLVSDRLCNITDSFLGCGYGRAERASCRYYWI